MSDLPTFTMRRLMQSGVHFGHHTRRWNPRMAPYIFGERNNIHILDLQQTVPMLYRAMEFVREVVAGGGRMLFVGTKRQASEQVAEAARRCGQYYVNHRWLGGMMTNWATISNSIKRLKEYDEILEAGGQGLTKKEILNLTRNRDKLEASLGGIKDMGGLPDVMVVIDTNKEAIAIQEAKNLNIPVVGILDSNSSPANITYPVPGNDDAIRAIQLYCELFAGSALAGIQAELAASGADVGAAAEAPVEELPVEDVPVETTGDAEVSKDGEDVAAAADAEAGAETTETDSVVEEAGKADAEATAEATA